MFTVCACLCEINWTCGRLRRLKYRLGKRRTAHPPTIAHTHTHEETHTRARNATYSLHTITSPEYHKIAFRFDLKSTRQQPSFFYAMQIVRFSRVHTYVMMMGNACPECRVCLITAAQRSAVMTQSRAHTLRSLSVVRRGQGYGECRALDSSPSAHTHTAISLAWSHSDKTRDHYNMHKRNVFVCN